MYLPTKRFRKSQPDSPDYHLQIKHGRDAFDFEQIYREQQPKLLTGIVHEGDISFYTFKSFDPTQALQSK